jgi:spore coat polysaccharide biosynthesis predicted glycosyltransferase SpsG
MKKKIIFLTDANNKLGYGHIIRTIRMAKLLNISKNNIFLILRTKKKFQDDIIFKRIYYEREYSHIYQLILKIKPDLLVIDLPKPSLVFEKKIYLKNINFLIYDRLKRKKIYSKYVINLNPSINKDDYKKRLIKKSKLLLGPKYFPIEFKKIKKKIKINVKNIFIFLGGGKNNLTLIDKIFSSIEKSMLRHCNIFFLTMNKIGNFNQNKLKNLYNLNIYFINNTNDIKSYIYKSDLSIISSGSISFESCFFNLPMILISVAENQIDIAKSWDALNVGYYVGKSNDKKFKLKLEKKIKKIYNFKNRFKIAQMQRKIFNYKISYKFEIRKILKNDI